ncbi:MULTISPECIES: NAD(P)/FAD-dependent oxidoreductase [unclassified Yoonia]|uniref:FAD-dependent oxidoreductase n=1 Tax=unclassified Yoonia TaxID=2629118 RepID=UPI002AFDDB10|nr:MULTISPECIES: NAD(P)/FAD-dependent oxidoreductase [unclassified Yoonia]
MRIGIAGSGIAGLAAAALLGRAGYDVTLIDQFDAPRAVGSGLVIQPVGLGVLDLIAGGASPARLLGAPLTRMIGHEVSGRKVLDVSYGASPGLAIHRASLFDVLWQAAMAEKPNVVSAARVTGRQGQTLTTTAGDIGPFDLVVDALGAGSVLSPMQARALPYGAIWGTVDWPEETPLPRDQLRQCYRRADRMVGVLPLGRMPDGTRNKAAVFWSLPRDAHDLWREAGLDAWRHEAVALWPDVAPFVAQITDPDQMTMARYAHGTLRRPAGAGIVHLGDAAHRASPQLGQGANMGLLDAVALLRALQWADGQDIGTAYAVARRWHVRSYQALSAAFTPQYQSDSRSLPVIRDRVLAPLSQIWPVTAILTRLVRGDLVPPLGSLDRR